MTATGAFRIWAPPPTPEGTAAFADLAVPFLARHEAHNNLPLGILDATLGGRYHEIVLVAALDAGEEIAAVLLRTPPYPMLLPYGCAADALRTLLEWMLAHDPEAPGMVGPLPEVAEAADWWAARRGVGVQRHMHQGVYELRSVQPRSRASGRMRLATPDDRDRVVPWIEAFELEALRRVETKAATVFDSFMKHAVRRLYLWEDASAEPVSLVGRSGRTPTGVRIGPVYTPSEARGHGYGEALVAAVAQRELDEGARACYLFTDLDYGVSNRLYLRVGFEPIGESAEMRFGLAQG